MTEEAFTGEWVVGGGEFTRADALKAAVHMVPLPLAPDEVDEAVDAVLAHRWPI